MLTACCVLSALTLSLAHTCNLRMLLTLFTSIYMKQGWVQLSSFAYFCR